MSTPIVLGIISITLAVAFFVLSVVNFAVPNLPAGWVKYKLLFGLFFITALMIFSCVAGMSLCASLYAQ